MSQIWWSTFLLSLEIRTSMELPTLCPSCSQNGGLTRRYPGRSFDSGKYECHLFVKKKWPHDVCRKIRCRLFFTGSKPILRRTLDLSQIQVVVYCFIDPKAYRPHKFRTFRWNFCSFGPHHNIEHVRKQTLQYEIYRNHSMGPRSILKQH